MSEAAHDLIVGFLEAPLSYLGMRRADVTRTPHEVRFEGDGCRSEGMYRAWSDGTGCIVSIASFHILETIPCTVRYPPFIAVRHDTTTSPGRNELTLFAGAGTEPSHATMHHGARCSYVEVEYLEPYFTRLEEGTPSFERLSARLTGMGTAITWSPEIARPFDTIERCPEPGAAASLIFSGAADILMGTLLSLPGTHAARDDRDAIAAVVRHISQNLDKPLRQEGLLGIAGMSAAKFKRQFKECTGMSMREYILDKRIERAKELLAAGATVRDAARGAGFLTPEGFSTAFKRATGTTPRQWKRQVSLKALPASEESVRRIYA